MKRQKDKDWSKTRQRKRLEIIPSAPQPVYVQPAQPNMIIAVLRDCDSIRILPDRALECDEIDRMDNTK